MKITRFWLPLFLSASSFLLPMPARAFFGISLNLFANSDVSLAPPPLPAYEIPEAPGDDYFWVPGHWSWDGSDYFWVPGTWVLAPTVGYLWTPGYWGCSGGRYHWHEGYWGPHVGFYGGVNYGGGYNGHGFTGGSWNGRSYHRNSAAFGRGSVRASVSYNGGPGGTRAQATAWERRADQEHHLAPTRAQVAQTRAARRNTALRASINHGRPPLAATPRAGDFGRGNNPTPRSSATSRGGAPPHQGGLVKAQAVSPREVRSASVREAQPRANRAVHQSTRVVAPREQRPQVRHASRPPSRPARNPSRSAGKKNT